MKKALFAFVGLICCIALTSCSSSSVAEDMANQFMQHFKEESFYDMATISKYGTVELIDEYTGINIIDYSIKSVSDEYKTKHIVTEYNHDELFGDGDFEESKELMQTIYPDYDVIMDTDTEWSIQSKDDIISEYIVKMDVEYSDLAGDTKRNSVTIKVTQKSPTSEEYIISEMVGIFNPYADL